MWDMLVRVDELVAQPILKQMRTEVLQHLILHADETPVTVRLEDGKGSKKAYAWDWRTQDGKTVIDFTLTRERDGPRRFLGSWGGALVADGYSGFDEVVRTNGIKRAGCWAHGRRKLKEAMDTGSRDAARVLRHVQRLFWIERAVRRRAESRSLSTAELWALRKDLRTRRSQVVIDRLLCTRRRKPAFHRGNMGSCIR